MAAQPTTRWQVNGYRFLVRRMEHALVRRDVRMLHDPMRSQSRALAVGAVVASLVLAACAALALIRPQGKIGDASIVVGKDSGAMFVVLDRTLRPVLNLASARLILDTAAEPVMVDEDELGTLPRGSLVGIPGAPSALPHDSSGESTGWTVCDSGRAGNSVTTSIIAGRPELGPQIATLADDEVLLVRSADGDHLVYDGTRARIDLTNRSLTRALGIEGIDPRPISRGLLNAIPEVPAIVPPVIAGAGTAPRFPIQGRTVGSVVSVPHGADLRYYVVLRDGVQEVGEATALIVQFADSQGSGHIGSITPDALANAPTVKELAVSTFPKVPPTVVDSADRPVGCLSWRPRAGTDGAGGGATLAVAAGRGLPIPDDARPVHLAQSDGPGPKADSAYLRPGSGGYVHTTGIGPDSSRGGSLFYVADTGVRYGIKDGDAARALGFDTPAARAPWQIIELLAPGPTLGREEALVAHDGVAPDERSAAVLSDN